MTTAQQQFDEGNYTETISILNEFLESNSTNIEAITLRGKAFYQLAFQTEIQKEIRKNLSFSLDDFDFILSKFPYDKEALLYRAYLLAEYFTDRDGILENDAKLLFNIDNECKFKAYNYLATVNIRKNNPDAAIEYLIAQAEHIKTYVIDNNPFLHQELARIYTRIGVVFCENKKDQQSMMFWDEKAFEIYPYNHFFNLAAGQSAFENENYDLAGKTIYQFGCMLEYGGGYDGFDEALVEFRIAIENGIENKYIDNAIMLGNRVTEVDILDQISFCKASISRFPENSEAYHFLATVLFEHKSYKEAIGYFDKIVTNKTCTAIGLSRWIYSKYKVEGKIPDYPNLRDIEPNPTDFYTAGINFVEWLEYENNEFPLQEFLKIGCDFYEQGYNLFYEYWYENKENPNANHQHYFAMLCNNYGIQLTEILNFEEAIKVHKIGYLLSPFWEQLNSLSRAEYNSKKFEECIATCTKLFNENADYMPTQFYVLAFNRLIAAHYFLLQYDEASDLAEQILAEKESLMQNVSSNIPPKEILEFEDAFLEIEARLDNIQDLRDSLFGNT